MWDPDSYLRFGDERSRPFYELVDRIGAEQPADVVDLGCGPGQLTESLARRWPTARIVGVDSSAEMLQRAAAYAGPAVSFELADLRTWRPPRPVEVLISNAALQWVPGHEALLPEFVSALLPNGWLAFQVPGNFTEPSHARLRELASDARFVPFLGDITWPSSLPPHRYLAELVALGCAVDAWETTYLHLLAGPDAVFRWISGTGARPVLDALPDAERTAFTDEYRELLRAAYPQQHFGTVLPFRRIFVVAQRKGG